MAAYRVKVLALDTSTRVGWAYFESSATAPLCGTFKLPKIDPADYAGRALPLFAWVQTMANLHKPDLIGFESPFIPFGNTTLGTTGHTVRLQIALATAVEMAARSKSIDCLEATTQQCKKALLGFGRMPKIWTKEQKDAWDWKKEMVKAAQARGWSCADDHQADAVGVALVAYEHFVA